MAQRLQGQERFLAGNIYFCHRARSLRHAGRSYELTKTTAMLYPIVRPLAAIGLRVFYRKIYLTNTARIPRNQPVILAANHPTAFLEPCILACFLQRPLYFLVRGDLFKQAFYAGLLRSLHMLPVYRLKDAGYGKLKENYSTFEACHNALAERKTIMILAEGRTIQEKRLRPLQKGAARIALGALDVHADMAEVYIVPVGVNFTYPDQPRTEVFIDFGEPIRASAFLPEYRENANQAMASLTDALRERLEQHIVIVENEADDELAEYLHLLDRTARPYRLWPIIERSASPLEREMRLAAAVNKMDEGMKQEWLAATRAYFGRLGEAGLDDRSVGGRNYATALNAVLLALGWPGYAMGTLWNYLPAWLGYYVSATKVKTLEFKAPVRWAATIATFVLYFLLWLLIMAATGAWGSLLPLVLALFLLGPFALYYGEFAQRFRLSRAFRRLSQSQQLELRRERDELLSMLPAREA